MLPKLTHLQCYVIHLTATDEHSGRYLRAALAEAGEKKSAAAFYQLMARMEQAEWIAGHYVTQVVDGQTIKERRYHATLKGMREFLKAAEFYSQTRKRTHINEALAEALA